MYSPGPYLRNFSIYISEKQYGKAEEVLREALKNGVTNDVIYASLGYLAFIRKDYEEAADQYAMAREQDPANAVYEFYLAGAIDQAGRREDADAGCLVNRVGIQAKCVAILHVVLPQTEVDRRRSSRQLPFVKPAVAMRCPIMQHARQDSNL